MRFMRMFLRNKQLFNIQIINIVRTMLKCELIEKHNPKKGFNTMMISVAIEVIWNMAAKAAIASEFKEIESEHFSEAILEFVEIPEGELFKYVPTVEAALRVKGEIKLVRQELAKLEIDSGEVRRNLRSALGKGNNPYEGGEIHRSEASKNRFENAARLAQDDRRDILTADYLWKALLYEPTPAMQTAFGGKLDNKPDVHKGHHLLEANEKELIKMAHDGLLGDNSSFEVHGKNLVQILTKGEKPFVFLITDSDKPILFIPCLVWNFYLLNAYEDKKPLTHLKEIPNG